MPIWLYATLVIWGTIIALLLGLSVWGAIGVALGPRWEPLFMLISAILIVPAFCYYLTKD